MATNETLLLKIGIDNSAAVDRLAAQKKQLDELKQAKKDLDKTDKDYQANLVILDRTIKAVNDSIRAQEKELDNTVKATLAAEGSNEQLRASLSLLTSQYNKLSEEERKNTKAGQDMAAQIKSITDQLKGNEGAVGDFRRNVGDYEGAILRASNTIAGMRDRLAALKKEQESVELGSDRFNDLTSEIEKLSLSIDQASGKVDEFGNKEPKNYLKRSIEDAFTSTTILANGLQTLNAVYGENTTLSEASAKAIQAIALSQAAANVVKEKGAIIDTAANVRMIAMTAAQKAYAIVVGNSTGAMKAFRVALAATGIGAVLVVLYELIFNFEKVNSIVKDLTATVKNFMTETLGMNETLVDTLEVLYSIVNPIVGIIKLVDMLKKEFGNFTVDIEGLNNQLEANNAMIEKNMKQYERQIQLMQAVGASEQQLAATRRRMLSEEIKLRDLQMKKADELKNKLLGVNGALTEEEQKLYDTVKNTYDNALFNLEIFEAEQTKIRREKAKERAKEAAADMAKYIELMNQYNNELIEDEEARALNLLVIQNEAARKEIAALKINQEAKNRLLESLQKTFEANTLKTQQEFADKRQKEQDEQFKEDLATRIDYFNRQVNLITKAEELELARAENTYKKAEELEAKKLEIKLNSLQTQLQYVEQLAQADGIVTQEELLNIQLLEEKIKSIKSELTSSKDKGPATLAQALGIDDESLDAAMSAIGMIQSALNQMFDLYKQRIEQQKEEIDIRYSNEIAQVNELKISEEDKAAKISELEKKAAMEKYELELQAFEMSQAMQITNAIIQTAQAVIAAYSSAAAIPVAGVALAPIMAAVAGGLGAAQIAVIASQKPPQKPQFFDGGYTEDGNPYEKSIYSNSKYGLHKGEYVVNNRVLNTSEGRMLVSRLDELKHGIKQTGITPSGFYSGGFTNGMNPSDVANIVETTVRKAPIYVRVSDITNKQNANARGRNVATVR